MTLTPQSPKIDILIRVQSGVLVTLQPGKLSALKRLEYLLSLRGMEHGKDIHGGFRMIEQNGKMVWRGFM